MKLPVYFASIAMNEACFIRDCLQQHSSLCDAWFIIEGADQRYEFQNEKGLSIDGTSDEASRWMQSRSLDSKILYLQKPGGFPDKVTIRNQYADLINRELGDRPAAIVIVIDIDEFICRRDLQSLIAFMQRQYAEHEPPGGVIRIPHVHFWRNAQTIIQGKYWNVPHDRCYWWPRGAAYGTNHNDPEFPDARGRPSGRPLKAGRYLDCGRNFVQRTVGVGNGPNNPSQYLTGLSIEDMAWFHFASLRPERYTAAKNRYYLNRGEAATRPDTTLSRAMIFESDDVVRSKGFTLHQWVGPWPEVCVESQVNREKYGLGNLLDGQYFGASIIREKPEITSFQKASYSP